MGAVRASPSGGGVYEGEDCYEETDEHDPCPDDGAEPGGLRR